MSRHIPRFFLVCVLVALLLVQPGTSTTQTEAEVKANYTKLEQSIAMRDGVKLFTSIYMPRDRSRPYPIMLTRTPYTVSPYGPEQYKTSLGPSVLFR